MNERLEQVIQEHANCIPYGEFTHESECIKQEKWFKNEVKFFYNLALEDVRKEVEMKIESHSKRQNTVAVIALRNLKDFIEALTK